MGKKPEEKNLPLLDTLKKSGIEYTLFCHSRVFTMQDVERELGISREIMAKTLILKNKGTFVAVVIQGNRHLEKSKLALALGVDANQLAFAKKEELEAVLKVPVGGIPPFGLNCHFLMDKRILDLEWIFCGCGTLVNSIKLTTIP